MKYKKNYIGFIISVSLLFISIILCNRIYDRYKSNNDIIVYNKISNYIEETIDNITFPIFNVKMIDKEIEKYIKDIDNLQYNVYITEDYVSVFLSIFKGDNQYYKVIDYSIKDNTLTNILDINLYKDIVLDKIKYKYSSDIYNEILLDDFRSCYYRITDEGMYFYFDSSLFDNIIYEVYVYVSSDNSIEVFNESYDKVVAFTFDDGPSEYTMDIVNSLVLNNSKATFFELGNRMKYNQEIVNNALNSGMEIGSHTYAHKNLNRLSVSEIDEEVNSTNILFNEITNEYITITRVPYGNSNSLVRSRINTPIISWNIDTCDWLYRDSSYVYNHIIENIKDGDIILMHDIYPETVEAVKKVLPYLVKQGYKVTTVTELANIKGKTLEEGIVYRSMG